MHRHHHARTGLIAAAGLLLLTGAWACGPRENRDSQAGNTADGVAADSSKRGDADLSDAHIAHIAMTANSLDSAMGVFARTRASNAAVRAFAADMVRDHGNSNAQATALAQRLSMTTAEHESSRDMREDNAAKQRDLSDDTGADFDRQYIEHEKDMHENVLKALDDDLIPNADNAELRQLLTQARSVVASHLERARQLDSTLSAGRPARRDTTKH